MLQLNMLKATYKVSHSSQKATGLIKMDNVRILQREDNTQRRRIKDAICMIQIQKKQPTRNRDQGIEVLAITMKLLS